MLSDTQKKTAQAIINIFETSRVRGNYGSVTLMAGDTGHLTYGRSQTTLASGNLYLLIRAYCEAQEAQFASVLSPYLGRLKQRDLTLDHDMTLRGVLRSAGDDPVMEEVQDRFFDGVYWEPSLAAANALAINTALGVTVVYDSHVHGAWKTVRDKTPTKDGTGNPLGEKDWVSRYVEERKNWLATNPNTLLHKTVYRMEAFQQLIGAGKWDLGLPLRVRSVEISEESLAAPVRVAAHDETERILYLQIPLMEGDDVRQMQEALKRVNIPIDVDGRFGRETETAVKAFQRTKGLSVDGIVGPATRAALGL
jgi:chitosanase